ncbi:MAG TPA: adenosylcobinamide-GDP ribazoletransferase [Gaiellaceae bacterium]|nr:adenosylcobinamide-GDP ribazoletransferase [Gaiellaceae bacterium]
MISSARSRDVARGGALFPLVGAGIGAVAGGLADALASSLGATLAAVLGVAAATALTGVLHLDGLADTADALGGTTRERALEIMRDHAVGAYGTTALVLGLAAKIAALATLADRGNALRYAVCAAAVGRAVPVVLAAALPYARPGVGTGQALGGVGWGRPLFAVALAAGFCVWLHAWPLLAVGAIVAGVAGVAAHRWLGGITGDILGASAELTEIAALVTAVALT